MTPRVATGPQFLQSVINDPRVWKWLTADGFDSPLQIDPIFDQGIGLEFEGGGFFFHRLGDGVMEVHTMFLPGSHGVADACRAAAEYLFCGTECLKIVTKVPADNVPATRLTEKVGFRLDYVQPQAWLRGGELHDVRHYSWDIDLWVRGTEGAAWARRRCHEMGNQRKGDLLAYRWAVMNHDYSVLEN